MQDLILLRHINHLPMLQHVLASISKFPRSGFVFRSWQMYSLMYIFVTSNRFKTVLLERGERMVHQGCVFLLASSLAMHQLVRKHLGKHGPAFMHSLLSSNTVLNRLKVTKNVH